MGNRRVAELFPDKGENKWYCFFKWMDDDFSGKISYLELEDMVRNELRLPPSALTEQQLRAIWHALDEDKSGLISAGEFGHFMRKGEHVHARAEPSRAAVLQKARDLQGEKRREQKEEALRTYRETASEDLVSK